jgi:hypothetical protein
MQFTDVFFLETRMRQLADPQFGELLQRVRTDGATDSDWNLLMTRHCTDLASLPHECVHLFPVNVAVDKHNEQVLRQMVTKDNPICTIAAVKSNGKKQQQQHSALCDKNSGTLKLAVGAKVMLLQNMSVTHVLVNGSPVALCVPFAMQVMHDHHNYLIVFLLSLTATQVPLSLPEQVIIKAVHWCPSNPIRFKLPRAPV